ncbi:hypothetical protein [Cupriavidus sp. BIC8F]|uniref:hypothetical protein n=1 Tax=Cupriavidus sp. BIC8F TaxID=3079014 RepID=UPI00291691B6|nr:hypothetical protein [Cupriavidus sp. BIC8F]
MTARTSTLVRIVDGLTVLLALDGLAFAVATMLTPITRQQVTTGAIVVYAAVALLLAALLLLTGLVLVIVAIVRRSAARWRIFASYGIGFALFGGCVFFVARWIAGHLP